MKAFPWRKSRAMARMFITFVSVLSAAIVAGAADQPAPKAGINIPEGITPLTVLQLNTKLPYSYCFEYKANPDPGRRYWKRMSENMWSETYPSGIKSTFRVLGHATVNGIEGTIVVKVSGTESLTGANNHGGLQAFIPDKGSAVMHHLYRNTGRGDAKWNDLGPMLNVQ
jgi:hypothetical protein